MQLFLTPKEAMVLAAVLEHVGGDPDGPRRYASDISNRLANLGYGTMGTFPGAAAPTYADEVKALSAAVRNRRDGIFLGESWPSGG